MQQKNTTPVSYQGKHVFTTEEKEQKSQQMLAAMREKEEIEAEFKTSKSNYKSKIDAKEGEIKMVANLLMAGFENRTYSCILTKNFDEGRREYHEIGSGKLIGTEPLTAGDYQTQLQIDEDMVKANNEAAAAALENNGFTVVSVDSLPPEITRVDEEEINLSPTEALDTPIIKNEPVTEKGGIKEEETPLENIEIDPFGEDDLNDDEKDPFDFGDI